jgi:hypothetical protein
MTLPDLSSRSAEGVLTVLQLLGIGPKTADLLCRTYATIQTIRNHAVHDRIEGVSGRALAALANEILWHQATERAKRIIEQAAKLDVRILTAFDQEFPSLLRSLPDAPLILYVKGVLRTGLRKKRHVFSALEHNMKNLRANRVSDRCAHSSHVQERLPVSSTLFPCGWGPSPQDR